MHWLHKLIQDENCIFISLNFLMHEQAAHSYRSVITFSLGYSNFHRRALAQTCWVFLKDQSWDFST
jgi:hypothetical protein